MTMKTVGKRSEPTITFHASADNLREGAKQGIWEILTKKPVTAGEEEIQRNPRSRSAKMRAAEKLRTGTKRPRD